MWLDNKWLGNKQSQPALVRLPWLKIGSVALLALLLTVSVFGVSQAFSRPAKVEEPIALVDYRHHGEFDYSVYVEPTHLMGSSPSEIPEQEVDEKPLYFTNIINNMNIEFTYGFVADSPVTEVSTRADIVAIYTGPSGWKKSAPVIQAAEQGDSLTISFPLELEDFNEVINAIEEELGIRGGDVEENVYDLVIEARVYVKAHTGSEWIEDTFVQPMEIQIGRGTLKWDNELALSERKFYEGFSYKHQGNFDYTIELGENTLYGTAITISPEPKQPPPVIRQPAGTVYFPEIVDIMKANFSYHFDASKRVTNLAEEVQVTAVLEYPEMWSKTFTLVPKTLMAGDFTVDFPVDINYFDKMVRIIRDEIGVGAATHELTIKADVHTTADTEFGPIDEVFTHTLKGKLGMNTMTWSEELIKSERGSIETTGLIPNKLMGLTVGAARALFSALTGVLLVSSLCLLVLYVKFRPPVLTDVERQAARAMKKYKGVIVDVKELPEAEGMETVIKIESLDGIIKTADNLLRPVLHLVDTYRHTYCVVDGSTMYEYSSGGELPTSARFEANFTPTR